MSDDVYRQHLEELGEDVIRHRLANRMAIGDRPENNPPYDFVHIWLGTKVAKRKRAENWRYGIVVTPRGFGASVLRRFEGRSGHSPFHNIRSANSSAVAVDARSETRGTKFSGCFRRVRGDDEVEAERE
jgi:hypothetical protein